MRFAGFFLACLAARFSVNDIIDMFKFDGSTVPVLCLCVEAKYAQVHWQFKFVIFCSRLGQSWSALGRSWISVVECGVFPT